MATVHSHWVAALAVFGAITGCVGLCMPAMTGVTTTGLRPQQTGLGPRDPQRRAPDRGALGIALLGSTALQRPGAADPDLQHLRLPTLLAAAGYLIAVIVTLTALGRARSDLDDHRPLLLREGS